MVKITYTLFRKLYIEAGIVQILKAKAAMNFLHFCIFHPFFGTPFGFVAHFNIKKYECWELTFKILSPFHNTALMMQL
jgi:hypothetical protein